MNEKLRRAIATVITLVAALWICYCVFCGFVYRYGSTFGDSIIKWALIVTVIILALLLATFIGVQFIKATDHHFHKFIIWERIFMFGICPIVFLGAGYFYSHFFTVHAQGGKLETQFVNSISKAERMFEEYRSYANNRIENYAEQIHTTGYRRDNKIHVLEICLFHPALDSLETRCKEWIKDVDEDATVWNPFLLGNIPYIEKGIKDWHDKLHELSKFKMRDEVNISYFDENEEYIQEVLDGLENSQSIYQKWKFPNILAILTAIIAYCFLIVAYFIQERNNKSTYTLLSNRRYKTISDDVNVTYFKRKNKKIEEDSNGGTF